MTASEKIDGKNKKAWNLMIHDPAKALDLSIVVNKEAVHISYQKGIAESLLNMGWCRRYMSQLELSLYNIMDALSIFQNMQDLQGAAKALNAVGSVYLDLGSYDSALDFFRKSLEKSREAEDIRREIAALANIGEVYREQNEFDHALEYYFKGLALAEKTDDLEVLGNILVGLGILYTSMSDFDKAIEFTSKALEACEKASDKITFAECLTTLGNLQRMKGDLEAAREYFQKSLRVCRSTENRREEAVTLNQLGNLCRDRGDDDDALAFHEQALELAREIQAKPLVTQSLSSIGEIYEARGDYRAALERFREYYSIESEMLQDEAEKRFQNLTLRYEIEKSKREAEVFRQKNEQLARTSEDLRQANHSISIISNIGKQITSTLNLDEMLVMVFRQVKHLMPVDSFGLARYDREDSAISSLFFVEEDQRLTDFSIDINDKDSLGAWCIRHQEAIFINDPEKDSKKYISKRGKYVFGKSSGSIIYVPLFLEGSVIGVITVQAQKKNSYTQDHLEILQSLSSYISIAVYNALAHEEITELNKLVLNEKAELEKAYQKISHMAHHDNLTGLPNRRLLLEFLNKSLAQAVRQKEKLAVLYIDLNDFKPVNDSLGHSAGDLLLRLVAERFLGAVRKTDTIARIGGDEFAAVIVGVKTNLSVRRVVQKIHDSMKEDFVVHDRHFTIGVSIGISLFPEDGQTPDQLLVKADNEMYKVKKSMKKESRSGMPG